MLQAIAYTNTSEAPSAAQRLVTFTLNDGDGVADGVSDTSVSTATINVAPVNDAPVLSDLDGDVLSYLENDGSEVIEQVPTASVTDVDSLDFDTGSLTVSLSGGVAAEDVLMVRTAGDISVSGASVRYQGTEFGTAGGGTNGADLAVDFNSSATLDAVSALLNAIAYENVSETPTTSNRLAVFTVDNGDGVANGGVATAAATATITIAAINDAPTIENLDGDTLSYIESAGAELIDHSTAATVSDADSLDFAGGTLTVSIASALPEDSLSIINNGDITVDGATIEFQGNAIGTASGGSGSALAVSLNASATPASVSALLAAAAYENTSEVPTEGQRTATFTLVDGDGVDNGGADTAVATTTISVTADNDPPVIDNLAGDSLFYIEQSGSQLIDQGTAASISDVDSQDFAGGTLTVDLTAGGTPAEDVLSIQDGATIGFDGSNVTHQGTTIGTATGGGNGNALVVSLVSAATPATVASLLSALTYENLSINPSLAARTVTVTLDDGDNGGQSAAITTTTINVSPVNAAPSISDLNNDVLAYIEGDGTVSIDQGTAASITDMDSPDLDGGSLTVSFTQNGVAAEDVLSVEAVGDISASGANVSYQGTVIGTVSGGQSASDLIVSFNGAATLSAVSALLNAVSYQNTSGDPSEAARTVSFTVNDGDGTANGGADAATVTTTINVTAVADPVSISFQDGVLPDSGYSGTRDAPIRSDSATKNYGTRTTLWLDGNPDQATFISWDLTSIPVGSAVQSATITINVVNKSTDAFDLYQVLVPWVESQVTYNDRSSGTPWEVAGAQGSSDRGSTVLGTLTAPSLGERVITLNGAGIAVLQSWIDDSNQNNGFVIQNYDNLSTDDLDFDSSEGSASKRPKLTIDYLPNVASSTEAPSGGASALRNGDNPFDVNADSQVSPLDALVIINSLNGSPEGEASSQTPKFFLDVSGDGRVSPLDVLLVFNYLNRPMSALGEGEGSSQELFATAAEALGAQLQTVVPFSSPSRLRQELDSELPNSLLSTKEAFDELPRSQSSRHDDASFDRVLSSELDSTLDTICDELLASSAADGLASDDPHADFFARLGNGDCEDEPG
jgi:hypothetical protein